VSEITDSTLAAIASGYSTGGLSKNTAASIYRTVRLLLASRSMSDISVFADARSDSRNRLVVPVSGKWVISFVMTPGNGPNDLRLEKAGKLWSKQKSDSFSRKSQARC
jgi:hypothetical protein